MQPIYLDHAATTPVRPEVREAMAPFLGDRFGNPSSVHRWGREARSAVEEARERLAVQLGCRRREIVFTAGGTEADNLAVLGRWRAARRERGGGVVACSAVEHKAVLGAGHAAADEGAELLILGVNEDGRLELGALDEAIAARPAVVSIMWGNNEVGTLQPVAEAGARCRAEGIAFHTDAVQAFGKVRVRVDEVACDLLSVSAHKLGGPKGTGALYVREGTALVPLTFGGGQEFGVRPGTENAAGVVGFVRAAELAEREREAEAARLGALRDGLEAALREQVAGIMVNGGGASRLPHVLNVSIPGVDQEALLVTLDLEGIAASSGSACQSGAVEPSHVLVAMGRSGAGPGGVDASIRFSLGRTTTSEEIESAARIIPGIVARLRGLARV